MLSHYGLAQVEAYVQGTIRLAGVSEGRHPLGRPGDRHDHSLLNHIIMSALYLLPVLNGNLPLGMLDRSNVKVSPDDIGPRHIAHDIKDQRSPGRLTSGQLCPGTQQWR